MAMEAAKKGCSRCSRLFLNRGPEEDSESDTFGEAIEAEVKDVRLAKDRRGQFQCLRNWPLQNALMNLFGAAPCSNL